MHRWIRVAGEVQPFPEGRGEHSRSTIPMGMPRPSRWSFPIGMVGPPFPGKAEYQLRRSSGCVLQRKEPPNDRLMSYLTYSTAIPCRRSALPMVANAGSVT